MSCTDPQSNGCILEARKLCRTVPAGSVRKTLVNEFSYGFKRASVYTIIGPSGGGKTSLLRLFNRLDPHDSGELFFHQHPVDEYRVTDLRRKIALTFQIPHMFPGTVSSNLAFCCPVGPDAEIQRSRYYLELVGLNPDLYDADPERLSVGQKQRVALARILVQEPEIVLLDEPTSALDPGAAKLIEQLILKLNRELNLTIIVVTHNVDQARRLGGSSLFLVDGRLIEAGPVERILESPENDMTRTFLKGDLA